MVNRNIDPEQRKKQRTIQQNRALHKLFDLYAETLNNAGLDMKRTLKQDAEIPWRQETVKEFLWRPVQKALLGKVSTTELTTKEIDEVFEVLNKHLGQTHGVHVPFPSIEGILLEMQSKERT